MTGPELVMSAAELLEEHSGKRICGAETMGLVNDLPRVAACDLPLGHGGAHFDRRLQAAWMFEERAEQEAGK